MRRVPLIIVLVVVFLAGGLVSMLAFRPSSTSAASSSTGAESLRVGGGSRLGQVKLPIGLLRVPRADCAQIPIRANR